MHPVFYEDEVDIHLHPKTGGGWQLRGQQKRVVTPGQNEKCYLTLAPYIVEQAKSAMWVAKAQPSLSVC